MSNEKFDLATEKFFYYCMGLRKGDMRSQLAMMKARYPDDTPERLARRFIAAQAPLSMVSSALIHLPSMVPALGPAFRFLGTASGTTLMMTLNMTLVMQIALIYGYDLDDRARIKELLAVIAATAAATSSTVMIPQLASLKSRPRALAGSAVIMTTSQLVGEIALRYFSHKQIAADAATPEATVIAA
jgi:hypothetical protein